VARGGGAARRPRLLTAAALLLLVVGAELALRAGGPRGPRELVELAGPAGARVARAGDEATIAEGAGRLNDRIAAPRVRRAGTFRVVLVGDSTAAGVPFHPRLSCARLLEASLRDRFPAIEVEVVNFARPSDSSDAYASVAIESLDLEPDVLVVCGGNDELQRCDLDDLRDGAWPRVRAWLRESRLVRLVSPVRPPPAASCPEPPAGRWVGDGPWLTATELARAAERLRRNLDAIAAAAHRRAVDLVLVTQPSNLRDAMPRLSHHSRRLTDDEKREYERLLRELDAAAGATIVPTEAERLVARLRALDPGVARATWLVGRLNERAGRPADAAALYELALEQDGCPERAGTAFNAAIRRVASERGARLADAQIAFWASARGPAPGADLFLDHCHPSIPGMARLADVIRAAVLDLLARRGAPLPLRHVEQPMLESAPIDAWLERLGLARAELDALAAGAAPSAPDAPPPAATR